MSNIAGYIKENGYHINYCEVVIDRDGNVFNAVPGHQEFLVNSYCNLHKLSGDEFWELIPISASPVEWLVEKLGWVSLWFDYMYIPDSISSMQKDSLKRLQQVGQIAEIVNVVKTREASKIEYFENSSNCIKEEIPQNEYFKFIEGRFIKV